MKILVVGTGPVGGAARSAAVELPRRIRINAIGPTVLVEATSHHAHVPGFTQVSAATVGQACVKAVEGIQTGQVYALDGK